MALAQSRFTSINGSRNRSRTPPNINFMTGMDSSWENSRMLQKSPQDSGFAIDSIAVLTVSIVSCGPDHFQNPLPPSTSSPVCLGCSLLPSLVTNWGICHLEGPLTPARASSALSIQSGHGRDQDSGARSWRVATTGRQRIVGDPNAGAHASLCG